ncbi:MAG: winged helix DNA-binding domain-containing protein, partial [Caldilineaceae bacterium]
MVRHLGALQAQDYAWGIWSVAARVDPVSALATQAAVEQALAEASIVRSWPMRRTLHLVAGADLRWMLATMAMRAVAQGAPRRRDLGILDEQLAQARDIWAAALEGGRRLTRTAMLEVLEQGGIPTDGQRGYHLLVHHAQEGLLCLGPNEGKEQTFVLLDEWIAPAPPLTRDEALATLALRYFTGHGPATIHDLGWWSGMPLGELRAGLSAVAPLLEAHTVDNREYWMAPGALD